MPNKKYRNNTGKEFITISLLLDNKTLKKINNIVGNEPDKNMSRFIEENTIKKKNKFKKIERRKNNSNLKKKTFTFSKDFVSFIKKSGNMSVFVEKSLIENLNLKI